MHTGSTVKRLIESGLSVTGYVAALISAAAVVVSRYSVGSQSLCVPSVSVQRAAHGFQSQMKLEAVDKRSPALIRVATVQEVETHRIKVSLSSIILVDISRVISIIIAR